jgi:hypothetical protein
MSTKPTITRISMSALGRACVKTRLGEGCAALFSQLPSSERSCQYNRLPHRRNRDGSSTRKLDIGVFTQPRSKTEVPGFARHVRFTLRSRHRQPNPSRPFGANRRLTQRSNYQLFARVRSVVNAQKESGSLSSRPKTGSGKTRDWKSIQEKPVEDTTARLSF